LCVAREIEELHSGNISGVSANINNNLTNLNDNEALNTTVSDEKTKTLQAMLTLSDGERMKYQQYYIKSGRNKNMWKWTAITLGLITAALIAKDNL
jgi:transposase